ncbi:J domain-containing protein [Herbaspirillum sp. YR522]|uniref:J domain-containing protein n=1 Tax=Herbaspirillum sp. YR522 TaxID=1144342 RepID=UPI00026FB420|nr:J domain-containing protein [Herbaspirillum sp. YR522]EJM95900.1 DnaJ-like protein [Herbaspirillum sp. YR522]
MVASKSNAVSLTAPSGAGSSLSKDQKAFNTLLRQIEQRRKLLAGWEQVSAECQPVYVQQLLPLRSRFIALSLELVDRLDAQFDDAKLASSDRQAISALILNLLEQHGDQMADEARLKALYNRHSGSDFDQDMTLEVEELKARMEAMFGESLGDDIDMSSPDEVMARARAKMAEHQAREMAKKQARAERRAARSGPAKADAAARRREAAQAELTQSLRDIYRKLASALHPDREPDELMRARKTEMMQSLNAAYEKQDLLHLLELQIQLQQIDQDALNELGDARLKHYNKLLKEQATELEHELLMTEDRFRSIYSIHSPQRLTPEAARRCLHLEIVRMQDYIDGVSGDLEVFSDVKAFKRWLKEMKRHIKEVAAYEDRMGFSY